MKIFIQTSTIVLIIIPIISMFSTCSEVTPRAPIPDGRMEQIMQPWFQFGTLNNFILIFLRIVFLVLLSLVIIMCLRWLVTDGHEGAWRAPFCRKGPDMRFVQNFTLPNFQAKNFALSISHNFNSFSDKNTKKWVKMEKFTPLTKILHCRRQ